MKRLFIRFFILSVITSAFIFFPRNLEANYGVGVSFSTNPPQVDESYLTFTITARGPRIKPGTKYVLLDGVTSNDLDTETASAGGVTFKPVCGGKDRGGELNLKTGCDPNHDWFHGNYSYAFTIIPENNAFTFSGKVFVNVFRPKYSLTPPNPTPKDDLLLTLTGRRYPYSGSSGEKRNSYSATLTDSNNRQVGTPACFYLLGGDNGSYLALLPSNLPEGKYIVDLREKVAAHNYQPGDLCSGGSTYDTFSFTVSVAGGTISSTGADRNNGQYVNPIIGNDPTTGKPIPTGILDTGVNNNQTSVTLLYSNYGLKTPNPGIIPGNCYLLARGQWTQEKYHGQLWWVPIKSLFPGWVNNYFVKQAGGNSCGFDETNDTIHGSGPDTASNYVRADANGNIWFRQLCTNMEGVRNNCTDKFVLTSTYSQTLFHITCQYFQFTDPKNLTSGGKWVPDVSCDPNLAPINNQGQPALEINEGCDGTTVNADTNSPDHGTCYGDAYDNGAHRLWSGQNGGNGGGFYQVGYWSFPVDPDTVGSGAFESSSANTPFELFSLPRDPLQLATVILRFAVGVGGGVAFLLMIFGSFRLIFSAGNPEAVQLGRETLTAAIIGLLVVVFAVFILQLVGISILGFTI